MNFHPLIIKTEKRFINVYSRFRAAFLLKFPTTPKGIEKIYGPTYGLKFIEGTRRFLIVYIGCSYTDRKFTKKRYKRIKNAMRLFQGARRGLPCELLDNLKAMEKYYEYDR